MRLYFVRHGESEANVARVFSNRGFQHPLTARGLAQARALAAHLADHHIARIYASPLQRAVQTADVLADALGVPIVLADALREWDVGIFEGTSDPAGWEGHRQVQEDWFVHRRWASRLPEGESFLDMRARFVPLIEQLVRDDARAGEAVVLVGHGGLYHAMLPLILPNIDYGFIQQHPFDNTAYALAEAGPAGLRCREWCGIAIAGQ